MSDAMPIPSLMDKVSPEEWRVRVDLAAAYRLVALFGWDDLVFTHLSARVPGTSDQFLINPYGLLFEEITASSLVRVDQEGRKLDDSPFPVNPAGFTIHSAIHAAREDAHCVMHTHSPFGSSVAAQRAGVLPVSQKATFVLSSYGVHDYEGIALREDEKARLAADLGRAAFLLLRNHGLLVVGRAVADAFLNLYMFETACAIQVRAQAGGAELVDIAPEILAGAREASKQATLGQSPGALAWPGLLRRLDRMNPGYRS
ncbi:MAG: class II aldolase/adducin family protein [Holophagaceae bacterium]